MSPIDPPQNLNGANSQTNEAFNTIQIVYAYIQISECHETLEI